MALGNRKGQVAPLVLLGVLAVSAAWYGGRAVAHQIHKARCAVVHCKKK
jgi:hypothetical protein